MMIFFKAWAVTTFRVFSFSLAIIFLLWLGTSFIWWIPLLDMTSHIVWLVILRTALVVSVVLGMLEGNYQYNKAYTERRRAKETPPWYAKLPYHL